MTPGGRLHQLPDDSRWGRLAGKYVRDDIARQVKEVVNVDGQIMRFYDGLLRAWKGGKLVLNPDRMCVMPWAVPSWRCWMAIIPESRECPLLPRGHHAAARWWSHATRS